jgi:hypothetical protein
MKYFDAIFRLYIWITYSPYEASSYDWGNPMPRRRLQFGNKWLSITTNLSAALHRLRLPEQKIYLWIDQMCINQADLGERSSQVNMMSSIYTHAQHVIAWVGENHLEEAIVARDFILELVKKDRMLFRGLHKANDEFLVEHGLHSTSSPKWGGFESPRSTPIFSPRMDHT